MADLARKAERSKHLSVLASELEPYLVNRLARISTGTQAAASGLSAHALDGPYHTGTLAQSQAPWAVTSTSFNSHIANPDAHHARQHDIISSSDHTITGAALSVVGATAVNTIGLITPSAAPGAAEALLKSTSAGNLALVSLTAPLIDTLSGNLSLRPAGGTVALQNSGGTDRASFVVGNNTFDINPLPDSAADMSVRMFRSTSTTGTKTLALYAGDNTATVVHQLSITGTSIFNAQGSAALDFNIRGDTDTSLFYADVSADGVGFGTNTPSYKVDVTGTGRFTSTLNIADGAVGTPSLAFTADANTGIYRSGTDAFSLVANGAGIVNVGATGAGINTAFDSTAALKVLSVSNSDITLFLKQKSGQTARMWRVEDSAGQELIVLDSEGNLQSGNPGFVSGLTGWQITPTGTAEFNNVWVRGELHASIFVMDEFHASGGTLVVAPAGKLENDATVNVTSGIESVFDIRTTSGSGSGSQFTIRTTSGSGSGSQFTLRTIENYFEITDPPSGHATVFNAGDTLRCKSLGNTSPGIDLYDVWASVQRVEDMTDYYRYYYTRRSGGSDGIIIPAGTAIISYGAQGDGRILLTADQNYAPYIDIFTSGLEPWNGDITPHTRLGRLDGVGLPGVSGIEQYGMVTSTDLSDASAPYIVNSNLQMFSYNVDSEWNNGNPTARITSGGEFRLGTDVDADSTTGLLFNPDTGAMTIGSASYPGTVTVYGSITVTGGNAAKTDFSNITATIDAVPDGSTYFKTTANQVTGAGRAYTAINGSNNLVTSVIPASAVTPGGAGLFLGSNYMGYHNGADWKTYIDSSGNMKLLGNASNNYLQWAAASNKLQGVGGGTEQWYADATDGKLKAGNGAIILERTGILVANDATSAGITLHRTNAFTSSTKAGRLWALSDLSPLRAYFSAGRSVGVDGDASSAAGILDLVGYNSSGAVAAELSLNGNNGIISVTGDINMNGGDITDIGAIGDVSTWTPGITFGGGSTGLTYSSRAGRYVKIGKLVYASCEIRLSAKGSSTGSAKITGLPATAATTAAGGVPSIIWYQMASNFVNVAGGVDTGTTTITLVGYTAAAASYASITNSDFANNTILQMTVMYEAA